MTEPTDANDDANRDADAHDDAVEAETEALHAQAEALAAEGRLTEAEPLYRTIVRRAKAALGKSHPGHAAALYALARVLSGQGKHAEAEGLLRRALTMFEEAPGVAQPPYSQTLHTLAGVLGAQDKFDEAEALLEAALVKQEAAVGRSHPSVGPTLTNLAIALVQQQRLDDAQKAIERSLAIAEEAYGDAHEETGRILTILAQVQAALGDEAAAVTARRALNSLVATHGEDHPLVVDVRPVLEDIVEPSAEIEEQLQEGAQALEARDADRAIAVLAPLVARARRDGLLPVEASASGMLAQALFVTGKRDEALALARRAVAIADDAGQEDAVAHFGQLVAAMERADGEAGIPPALNAQIHDAIAMSQTGDTEGAVRLLETSATEAQAAGELGNEATVRIVLGQMFEAAGDRERARTHLTRALTIAEEMGDEAAASHVRGMLASGAITN